LRARIIASSYDQPAVLNTLFNLSAGAANLPPALIYFSTTFHEIFTLLAGACRSLAVLAHDLLSYLASEPRLIFVPNPEILMPQLAERGGSVFGKEQTQVKTVLVAQDEPDVRKLVRIILERNGYRVLEATNAREAIRHCVEHHEPIDLLLADGILPSMTLRQLAECVQGLRPEIRVLCMSGYSPEVLHEEGAIAPGTAFLQKPFLPLDLIRRVVEVLGE